MAYEVQAISAIDAAPQLGRVRSDETAEHITSVGQSFKLTTPDGGGVFTLCRVRDWLWINAAQGRASADLCRLGFELVEEMARQMGLVAVGFQTVRGGLMRKAQKHGYTQIGRNGQSVVMSKTL